MPAMSKSFATQRSSSVTSWAAIRFASGASGVRSVLSTAGS